MLRENGKAYNLKYLQEVFVKNDKLKIVLIKKKKNKIK